MNSPPTTFIPTCPAGYKLIRGNRLESSVKATKFECLTVNGAPFDPPVTTWFPLSQTKSTYSDPTQMDSDYILVTNWIFNAKDELHG